jgi:hypothetical protein
MAMTPETFCFPPSSPLRDGVAHGTCLIVPTSGVASCASRALGPLTTSSVTHKCPGAMKVVVGHFGLSMLFDSRDLGSCFPSQHRLALRPAIQGLMVDLSECEVNHVEWKSFVRQLDFDAATVFLDALSPRGKYFGQEYEPRTWIFRGHGISHYSLMPSALRLPTPQSAKPVFLRWNNSWFPVDSKYDNGLQVESELETLLEFLEVADESGLPIPGYSIPVRGKLYGLLNSLRNEETADAAVLAWPPVEYLEMMALAQHYGVPTRLLDWSYNPYIAAYFAASEAARNLTFPSDTSDTASTLSVWALSLTGHEFYGLIGKHDDRVNAVNPPTAHNPNLRAQEGVFTFVQANPPKTVNLAKQPVDRTPLDKALEGMFKKTFSEDIDSYVPILCHLRLPIAEAPKLLRLLAKEGITGAKLFPGYAGVAKALLEQQHWDKR